MLKGDTRDETLFWDQPFVGIGDYTIAKVHDITPKGDVLFEDVLGLCYRLDLAARRCYFVHKAHQGVLYACGGSGKKQMRLVSCSETEQCAGRYIREVSGE